MALKVVVALACAGMFFGLSGPAMPQEASGAVAKMVSKKSGADVDFSVRAAEGGMLEVDLGKLAVQKGSSDRVKRFGQRMVDDHGKAGDELRAIAGKNNLVVPDQVDANDQLTLDHLSHLTGDGFDHAYMRQMVMEHEQAVALFQREMNSGTNADLRNWAASTLPTLQYHLRRAREIENLLSGPSL